MKKLLFFSVALLTLTFTAFAQPDAPRYMQMVFAGFKLPFTCYAMGLNQEDFSNLSISIDVSRIKDKSHGVPIINSIQGVQITGAKPRFTYLQLEDYFGYMTIPAPISLQVAEKSFPISYISMERRAVVGTTYKGDIRINSADGRRVCMVRIMQHP